MRICVETLTIGGCAVDASPKPNIVKAITATTMKTFRFFNCSSEVIWVEWE